MCKFSAILAIIVLMLSFSGCEALQNSATLNNPISLVIAIITIAFAFGVLTSMWRMKKKVKQNIEAEKRRREAQELKKNEEPKITEERNYKEVILGGYILNIDSNNTEAYYSLSAPEIEIPSGYTRLLENIPYDTKYILHHMGIDLAKPFRVDEEEQIYHARFYVCGNVVKNESGKTNPSVLKLGFEFTDSAAPDNIFPQPCMRLDLSIPKNIKP